MHIPINVKSPNNISKWQMGFNSVFKGLKEPRILFTGEETWLKLSNIYLTERAHHFHTQTRPLCSHVKNMLNFSSNIHRFVLYKFVPQGQTETTLTTLT
jgi:hypothetical protein